MSNTKIDLDLFNKPSSISDNHSQKDFPTSGLLIATLSIILTFILIAINNFWVSFVIAILMLLFLIFERKNKEAIAFTAIIVLIAIWQFVIAPKIRKDKCKITKNRDITHSYTCPSEDFDERKGSDYCADLEEGFYTLFTPFHREEEAMKHIDTTSLSSKASKLWKVREKPLVIGSYNKDDVTTNMISRLLLSRARILTIKLVWEDQPEKLIRYVTTNKIDAALVPSPVVDRMYREKIGDIGDIRFIANVEHYYLFCISSIVSGIQNIYQLERKRVGVPLRMHLIWEDLVLSIFPDGHKGEIVYKTDDELFRDLNNYQIDAFFWCGVFPNPFIDGVILSEITHKYQLVPVHLMNENAFVKEHIQYFPTTLDMSQKFMPSRYLPTGLGRIWMTNFTAQYLTLGFDITLICNKKLDNFTGYEITQTIFDGRNLLARYMNQGTDTDIRINNYTTQWRLQYHPLTPADIAKPCLPDIPVQEGAKMFYVKKGLISYCQEPGCMQVIGVERCKLCDKLVRKTEMQWRDELMREKTIPKHFAAVPFEDIMGSPKILTISPKDIL